MTEAPKFKFPEIRLLNHRPLAGCRAGLRRHRRERRSSHCLRGDQPHDQPRHADLPEGRLTFAGKGDFYPHPGFRNKALAEPFIAPGSLDGYLGTMRQVLHDIEAGKLTDELRRRGISPGQRVRVVVEPVEDDEPPITALNAAGGAFDWLADEPDLYSDADLVERYRP